ncbi:cytochrome P450 [Fusarium albosuccineum]|uniref:Cytochrome P450 n=1 Tax=Fusarium albosuccineum TaxID=1237068 RepID=A0A8H4KGQ8_9HYPO|nr:cytochrome P450 [Fusarium albosuccineum]
MLYNVFLHPLRRYPGPRLMAMTRIPYTRMALSGQVHRRILELHQTYGPVVRVAPEILSYNHPDAWKDIRGHRKNGAGEHGKDPVHQKANAKNIIGANREDHRRYRSLLAHGFSAQTMLKQQPIIKSYVDLLFQRLHEQCDNGRRPLDVVNWFNFTTFDLVGDLAFGEPFGCLESSDYHPWVALIFASVKSFSWASNMRRYPSLEKLLASFIPKEIKAKFEQHNQLSAEKVRKRLSIVTKRPDFMDSMTRKGAKEGEITFDELASNAGLLIMAGSETTATLLSAAVFYLATHPHVLTRLTEEVRSAFTTEDEIDLLSVQKLPYLLAVLDETLRIHPPVPSGSPRRIAPGGDVIVGQYVPEGTVVEIYHWAVYHNPDHFLLPDSFIPERWLGDARFANDKKDAFQPFSLGPRNCIGKNLAYSEMRMILSRLVWNFDISIAEESLSWYDKAEVYILWQEGPLNIYLSPRKQDLHRGPVRTLIYMWI